MPNYQQIIGQRYQLIDTIGSGGMGIVYQAVDRLQGETVALKRVLIPDENLEFLSRSPEASITSIRLSLAHEFKMLASLRHPHIISVLDYGFDAHQQPYFTMDFMEHRKTILEAGGDQSLTTQTTYLIQILQALTYLHQRGIIHRDLKPSNVLVEDGLAKVLDFGLSVRQDAAEGRAGTITYMSPEVLRDGQATTASDLYAVGLIGYELFTGHPPFDRNSNRLLMDILMTIPDVSKIPIAVRDIISKLLAKEPKARYDSAYDVIEAFSTAIQQAVPTETAVIRESFLQAAEFVGREAELQQLTSALAEAFDHQGSSWLVGGESGVGKSRLLDELRIRALVKGATVLQGQAVEGGGLPYQLWRRAIRRLVLNTDLNDLEASILKEIVPDIGALLERQVATAPQLEGSAGQQRLMITMADVFKRQKRPVVLLVEDLQWSTEDLTILKHFNRLVENMGLLIVGSYRHDEQPELPIQLPAMQLLHLNRLQKADIIALSQSMLGQVGQQQEIIDWLTQETEGNVFFLVETVRVLAEEAGQLRNIGQTPLPERVFGGGIETVVNRRLARVSNKYLPLLQYAALIGRTIDLKVMANMANTAQLNQWLYACEQAIVLEIQDNQWRFAHDKLREGLLTTIDSTQKQAYAHQIGQAVEQTYADDLRPYYGALATYYEQAGAIDKTLLYLEKAGDEAKITYQNETALSYYNRLLGLLRQLSETAH